MSRDIPGLFSCPIPRARARQEQQVDGAGNARMSTLRRGRCPAAAALPRGRVSAEDDRARAPATDRRSARRRRTAAPLGNDAQKLTPRPPPRSSFHSGAADLPPPSIPSTLSRGHGTAARTPRHPSRDVSRSPSSWPTARPGESQRRERVLLPRRRRLHPATIKAERLGNGPRHDSRTGVGSRRAQRFAPFRPRR